MPGMYQQNCFKILTSVRHVRRHEANTNIGEYVDMTSIVWGDRMETSEPFLVNVNLLDPPWVMNFNVVRRINQFEFM